jgi:diguanylate cyclase (GGDEF)-like protein
MSEDLRDENDLLRDTVAQLSARVAELESFADTDTVTRLPNRRRFLNELERIVGQTNRHGTPAALLHIDLDGLRQINGRYGHAAGDAALVHIAELLSALIRHGDVLARTGGDTFGLILDHLDHNSAIETAERLGQCIAASPIEVDGEQVAISASIGIATILAGDWVDDVVARAARNVGRAKAGV